MKQEGPRLGPSIPRKDGGLLINPTWEGKWTTAASLKWNSSSVRLEYEGKVWKKNPKLFSDTFCRIPVQFPTCCNVQSCRTFLSPIACQTPHIVNRRKGKKKKKKKKKKIQLFQSVTMKAEEITLNGLNSAIRWEGVLRGLAGPMLHIHRSRMRLGGLLRKWCRNQEPAVLPDQVH